jgi:hypothetical protein
MLSKGPYAVQLVCHPGRARDVQHAREVCGGGGGGGAPKKCFQHEKDKHRKIETTLLRLRCVGCVDLETGRRGVLEVTSTRTPMRMPALQTGEFRSCTQTLHENSGIMPLNTPQPPNYTALNIHVLPQRSGSCPCEYHGIQ